jgi:ribose transport system permease protein
MTEIAGSQAPGRMGVQTVPRGKILLRQVLDNLVWIILLAAILVFSITIDGFFSIRNYVNVMYHSVFIGVLAIAETYCLIGGQLDLSIESVAAFGAILSAWLMGNSQFASGLHLSPAYTILLVIAFGCAIGLINGLIVVKLKIDAFLVTLAMYIGVRGLALWLTGGKGVSQVPATFRLVDTTKVFGIPFMVWLMIFFYIFFFFVLMNTRFGRHIFVVGGNVDAAYKHGVSVEGVLCRVFVLSGAMSAATGLLMTARADGASAASAQKFLFEVFAAVVIGGVGLKGGVGSLVGVFAGVILLSSIRSALNILAISPFVTDIVRGLLVLFAIVLDSVKRMVR